MTSIPTTSLQARVAQACGRDVRRMSPLHGGCVSLVYRALLVDGQQVVVKVDPGDEPTLHVEAYMLDYLARHSRLPVPRVLHAEPDLLVMDHLPGESRFTPQAEAHLAELLAELHQVQGPAFGLERDTRIGRLPQPNGWWRSWIAFFREQRLRFLARLAVEMGRMPDHLRDRVERLADDLERWLVEPEAPALLHGDLWSQNVLALGDRITGVVDPAIYYGHPEVELAYVALFHSFGRPFFRRYQELRPLPPEFFQVRMPIYNLYPLLSHVCHFGGGYVAQVERTLAHLGYG